MTEQKKFYDELYTHSPFEYDETVYRRFIDILSPQKGALLDVACGMGKLLWLAKQRGLHVAGLDISAVAIGKAREFLPDADLRDGDAESLPWPDGSFDYVTCLGSIDRFGSPSRGVQEIVRVMKPEGTAMILLQNNFSFDEILRVWGTGREAPVKRRLSMVATKNDWKDFLEANGLVVRKIMAHEPAYPFWDRQRRRPRSLKKFLKHIVKAHLLPSAFANDFIFLCTRT